MQQLLFLPFTKLKIEKYLKQNDLFIQAIDILYYQHGINIRGIDNNIRSSQERMLWKKITTEKTIENGVPSDISQGRGCKDLHHSLKAMDSIYKNLPSQNTRNSQFKIQSSKKINKKDSNDANLQVNQKNNQNYKKQQKNKQLSSLQNNDESHKNNQNQNLKDKQEMKNVKQSYQQVKNNKDHNQQKKQTQKNIIQSQNLKVEDQKFRNLLEIGNSMSNNSPFNSGIRRGNSNTYQSNPRNSAVQSQVPSSSFHIVNETYLLKNLQSKFKANSLGGEKQKRQSKKKIKTGFERMNSSQLQQELEDEQISQTLKQNNGISYKQNINYKIGEEFADELPIDDFIQQMKEAGIDVADFQSNCNDDSKSQFSKQIIQSFSKQQFDRDIQTIENYQKLLKSQNQSQNRVEQNRTAQFQGRLKTQNASSIRNSGGYLTEVNKLQIKQELARILHIVKEINIYKSQIMKIYDKIIKQKETNTKFVSQWTKQLIYTINNIYESKKAAQFNQTYQNLKFKVLQLESQILQKEVNLQKQKSIIYELKKQNEELTQNAFEINQKLAQSELAFQQKIQQFITKHEEQLQLRIKQDKKDEYTQKQIRRLNQQVQQLTRLYETSQQQNRKVLQNQKLTFQIQMQKIARKQAIIDQKELKLQQKIRILKQEEEIVKQNAFKNSIRQKQLIEMQKILKQKLMKMQELEQQINQGFAQIEEGKREINKSTHKYEQQIKNLRKQKNAFLARIQRLVEEKKQFQEELNHIKSRKSTQRQYNKPTQHSTKKILDNIYRNRQMLTQYERDGFDQDYETQIRDQRRHTYAYDDSNDEDLQYTFMKTQRIPTQKDTKFGTKFNSRQQSNEKVLYRKSIKTEQAYPTSIYSSPYTIDKKYQQNKYKGINQNYKRDPKFMSQVISASPKSNKFTASGFKFGQYKSFQQSSYNNQAMSPKLRQILIKSKSANKISASKLDELDNKIESLRKQIKREVNAAKRQQ